MVKTDKTNKDKVFSGEEKTYLNNAKLILSPSINNESCTVIWFPGIGKSFFLKEIFEKKRHLKKLLGSSYDNTIFVNIDLNTVISESKVLGYLQLLYLILSKENGSKRKERICEQNEIELLFTIKEICKKLVQNGKKIVINIDEIESLSLIDRERIIQTTVNIVYVNRNYINVVLNLDNLNTLDFLKKNAKNYTLLQNLVFIPLPTRQEMRYYSSVLLKRWKLKLTKNHQQILEYLSGSKLFTSAFLRILKKGKGIGDKSELLAEREMELKQKILFDIVGIQEKKVLEKIIFSQELAKSLQFAKRYLEEIGVIKKDKGRFTITPQILSHIVKKNNQGSSFKLNKQGQLIFGVCELSDVLSKREYSILMFLYENRKEFNSREKMAKFIWKEDYINKYFTKDIKDNTKN